MEGANAESDHSMTWEDFFGSTTDLAPALIGIYDSLLEPSKKESAQVDTAKDARNDPPVKPERKPKEESIKTIKTKAKDKIEVEIEERRKSPTMIAGSVKLPIATVNKSSLYSIRTKSDQTSESDGKYDLTCSDSSVMNKDKQRTFRETKTDITLGTLSPNVQRMISSARETTTIKFQKKTLNTVRSSTRRSNIPLVGATSKISQSGVEILPSVDIHENKLKKDKFEPVKPEFKLDAEATYDVPKNNRPAIYDVPNTNKTAFESLSLPYIDQSIELSITGNDREFDIKLSSNESSPHKSAPKVPPRKGSEGSPAKFPKVAGTNSLNRNDFKNDSPKKLAKSGPYPEAIGSTGNLKSAIPEKEVVRLNPPCVEVTRPLSMSSIASSSSTSSSGVQNKGGVNSAYLASIESLDDHSDADMTSANGSNNFVNSAGMLNNSITEDRNSGDPPRLVIVDEVSGMSQLERVCAEIVQTENVYVEDLRQVVEGYLHVWRRETTFPEEELSELFNNIEDIYTFNRSLCEALNSCRLDATCIARCFVDNTSGFSVYTSYCTGYPRTMVALAALASKPHSAREFRERQIELGHLLPLASYLLKPVQRILKYHLLLQNMVKQCASTETEYALLKMTGIAQHIDDMKRKHEHAVRVQEIQSLLYGWNGPDLTTYGELCAEGTFRVFGAKAMRHAFLFDKLLLVTKNREDGILAYKSHIMCNNMMLVESIAGAPLSFHVIPWDAPRSQLTLQARSPRHKREWTLLLKRVILENYNAVIPSHARQLVMELGQNKTDDDMLAEKSHNLITQASMRKQLSAPEYLEKRKLDRERRKSFENGIRGRMKKTRKYTLTNSRSAGNQDCDCTQVSAEKGTDYTCENCYIDLCSDCETELNKDKAEDKCVCRRDDKELTGDKCPECDRSLQYIDAGSAENIERKAASCKCSDFQSSQESFGKEFVGPLNKTREYHSSDNIVNYKEVNTNNKDELGDTNSMTNVRNTPKTCLKCAKIKENIVITDTLPKRPSRCTDIDRHKIDSLRSKSKDDPQRSKISKIGTWRRKSEPGLQQNTVGILAKKSQDSDSERNESKGCEKIEFECRNCGSNKITRKVRSNDGTIISDPELDSQKRGFNALKPNLEIRMYNTKNVPKKISKIKKNRAKGLRLGSDTTAKFYADFSTDVSTENILHITESNDSLNVDKPKEIQSPVSEKISKDDDIDEETYKKLIEKTDSFKKNELEKVKYLNKQKVISEGSEIEDKTGDAKDKQDQVAENCEDAEQPLEQIISQLLMQNREFQKLVKKQQLRNSAQRRHQRLMKSHSNPEHVIAAKNLDPKLKPKYVRQSSEIIESKTEEQEIQVQSQDDASATSTVEEDHIYETLRVESRVDESLHSLDSKSKLIQHSHVTRPKVLPSPPNPPHIITDKGQGPESDYVYLSFDHLNKIEDAEGIYDVPVKSPQKVETRVSSDYYVVMDNKGPVNGPDDPNIYDSLVEICRRKKDAPNALPTDYLPMSSDQQSPNTPEIWLIRQKEHFNVSRDRKSGSLPRSFQVVTSSTEDNSLSTFKCTPNSNSKTYLNRDGKVKNSDRPYTIASDQSEISYDDVENYMSENDILKFKKSSKSEVDYSQNISQSTLELEEEIDRCYKNNFEGASNLDKNKNESLLTVSQPNLNTSMTSSCEILPLDRSEETPAVVEIIHPEHKIYKPASSMLSLKNVLSRFKSRTPNKNEESEINANDQSSPDNSKSEVKSPTSDKKSGLNPKSYSKNLLQRFRSIIGEEHSDANENRSQSPIRALQSVEDIRNNLKKNEIKVVVTSNDVNPTTSTIIYATNNESLSKSVCENSSMSESQNEKNNLETLSHSCGNITQNNESRTYENSVSMVSNISSSFGSPSKSNNSSYQSLNKLPIYMQGSKHLGARIAQSDYVDPTTLISEKSALKNVNVLINKNAVRPDSLFSNSSFVTSSSEGTYLECQKINTSQTEKEQRTESTTPTNSDESFYEKSFEKIEQVTDEDVFRDSAVYSDQEEAEYLKTDSSSKINNKDRLKRASFKSYVTLTTTVSENTNTQIRTTIASNKTNIEKEKTVNEKKTETIERVKPKVAPPVPVKPKISHIPATNSFQSKQVITRNNSTNRTVEKSLSNESVNTRTIKRNTNIKPSVTRCESTPSDQKAEVKATESKTTKLDEKEDKEQAESPANKFNSKSQSNIQIKRLSFERASLDSATRKTKTNEVKRPTIEPPKITTKSVFERRMEIESMSKIQIAKPSQIKKPTQLENRKSITTKVASFERSVSDTGRSEIGKSESEICRRETRSTNITPSSSTERANIPSNRSSINPETDDPKSSWVKQVVNKFQ